MLPHHVTIRKGGKDYSDVRFTAVAINDPQALSVFAIPESASVKPTARPLENTRRSRWRKSRKGCISPRLFAQQPGRGVSQLHRRRRSAYTETQSKVLARLIREQFPNKPIQYAAVTHHHYDHIGGVRGIAAEGATLLVASRHEPPSAS